MAVPRAKVDVKVDATAPVAVAVDGAARAVARAAKSAPMAAAASPARMVAAKAVANHGVTPAPNHAVAVVDVAVNAPSAAPSVIALRQTTKAAARRWTRLA